MLGRLGLASGASGGCTAAWRHRLDTTLGRPTKPDEPFLQVQYRTIGVIQYIMPLWEDCAGSMGLPRDMEGVARLQRAAMTCVRLAVNTPDASL